MSRPYIVFAESNIKTGCRVTLGEKTLVVGPNGTGKSTVANTLELALTGRVSDLVGRREVAKEVELMALAPDKKGALLARLRLSDGSECLWRAGGKTKKAVHRVPEATVDPEIALPLRPVYDAIMGNVETARKFFMRYAVGVVGDPDVLQRIPPALHALYKRATLSSSIANSTAVDRLLSALETSKKQAREAKAAAKASSGLSDSTASGLAPLPTEAEDKAMRDALRAAESERDVLRDRLTRREALAAALGEQETLKERLSATEAAYRMAQGVTKQAEARLAAHPATQAADPLVMAFRTVIAAHVGKGLDACECCGTAGLTTATFQGRLAAFDDHFRAREAAQQAHEAAKAEYNAAVIREQQVMNEGKTLWSKAEAIAATIGSGATDAPDQAVIDAVEAKVADLTAKLREVDALKAAWAVASRARDGVVEANRTVQEWEALTTACVEAVSALLDNGVSSFTGRVQAALPPTDKFALALRDGERAVFQFGLMHDTALHTALSGAEWARVTAALAGICAPSLKRVSVVIPEERAFDPDMLSLVLQAFSHLDSQVLFTSPIMPTSAPAGWMVVNTLTGDHTAGVDPIQTPDALPSGGVIPAERAPG